MDDSPVFSKGLTGLLKRTEDGLLATREGILGKFAAISLGMSWNTRLEEVSRLAKVSVSEFENKGEMQLAVT